MEVQNARPATPAEVDGRGLMAVPPRDAGGVGGPPGSTLARSAASTLGSAAGALEDAILAADQGRGPYRRPRPLPRGVESNQVALERGRLDVVIAGLLFGLFAGGGPSGWGRGVRMTEALEPVVVEPGVVVDMGADVVLPALIVDAGPDAVARFLEFFAARIANARTRAAYGRAVGQFLAWCEDRRLGLTAIAPLHVAAYIRTHPGSVPTVKQHLAAIRVLCDWLVVSQVLPVNPAAAVRGPKHVVRKGSTPVLSPAEARKLLDTIDTGTLTGVRDRAVLSVMLYSLARVSAVLGMRRQDYFEQGSRGWLRLHEKGGRRHDVPAHHRAAAALDEHVEAAELKEPKATLFQSVDPAERRLTGPALRRVVLAMIKRRAAAAGLPSSTCCHTFRATGVTAYLSNGGTLEHAQQIAGHASPKTTKLYDRPADTVTVDEIECIVI